MRWELRLQRDRRIVLSAIKKKRPLPDWYLDEPTLLPGDDFYVREFWILDTTRPRGDGVVGPLSVPAMEDRGERRHGFGPVALDLYVLVLRRLDATYLEWKSRDAGTPGSGADPSAEPKSSDISKAPAARARANRTRKR